eukprot:TRINITY_DN1712_c0_g1_i1.p1 TRINITY_DN1712_c0_g1~~TRINITY_DN1712_c0_g1_i1.p1  ORF type:complete len:213 (+),score=70.20 TRINITY_DN1712_c0_g1_i1:34-672(+)
MTEPTATTAAPTATAAAATTTTTPTTTTTTTPTRPTTQKKDEIFDVFDEENNFVRNEKRCDVHKNGYYHRSVNVVVFNVKGEMLIQKRMDIKDVCPGLWDLSTAEHLKPGETYEDAAVRGLNEELTINLDEGVKLTQLRPAKLYRYDNEEKGIKDYEFTELWKLANFEGKWEVDNDEVSEAKWISLSDLTASIASDPSKFTPWMLADVTSFE